jgi:hypothetical protein
MPGELLTDVGILKNKIVDYYRKLGRVVDASIFSSRGR